MPEPSDYWTEAAACLAELGADPVLIGGLAASAYRQDLRLTVDVDFLVRSLDGVAEAFEAQGYEAKTFVDEAGRPYAVFLRAGGKRIDVLLAETAFQLEAIDRAVDGRVTPEDLIVLKLVAWRSRDRDDVLSIVRSGLALDEEHIDRWAEAWQVADRWADVRRSR